MKFFLLFIPILFLFACSLEAEEEKLPSVYDDVKLELNDGKKWKVSPEMMPHIKASVKAIDKFENADANHYTELAEELIGHKNKFVSECNMHGKSHDILHDWLIPYIGLLDAMKASDSKVEQAKLFEDIKNARDLFNEYFE